MSHLGSRAAALVDGELDHDTRDRLLAHVALCAACRSDLEAERTVKSGLATLPEPRFPSSLAARLMALAEPGEPLRPPVRAMAGSWRPPSVPVGPRPPRGPRAARSRPRRSRAARPVGLVAGAMSFASVTLASAFALGGPVEERGVPVSPSLDRFTTQETDATGGTPSPDGTAVPVRSRPADAATEFDLPLAPSATGATSAGSYVESVAVWSRLR